MRPSSSCLPAKMSAADQGMPSCLDLLLDVLNRVRWLDIESDRLASQSLDEDLHL